MVRNVVLPLLYVMRFCSPVGSFLPSPVPLFPVMSCRSCALACRLLLPATAAAVAGIEPGSDSWGPVGLKALEPAPARPADQHLLPRSGLRDRTPVQRQPHPDAEATKRGTAAGERTRRATRPDPTAPRQTRYGTERFYGTKRGTKRETRRRERERTGR